MKLLELAKKARDEKWNDEKIELEIFRLKDNLFKEILKELGK